MLSASLYITVCSARNRVRARLRRLREPRYFVGAVAGAAYLYFSIFARMRTSSRASAARRRGPNAAAPPAVMEALIRSGPALAGMLLLVATVLGWLMPFDSGLLDFSESEVQFLFPAPVSRRQLLVHRMLRSQLGMLFGSVVVAVVSPVGGLRRVQVALGTWLLMATTKVYFTGISLSRARLGSAVTHARRVARLPVVVLLAGLGIVAAQLWRAWVASPPASVREWMLLLGSLSTSGASGAVLWPFVAVARPLFAAWPAPFFYALAQSAVVLVAVVAWVLASDEAFQDAAADATAKRETRQAVQKGTAFRARATGLRLNLTGRPELAFAWKAALQTLRIVDRRSILRLVAIVVSLSFAAGSIGRANGFAAVLGAFALVSTAFTVLMAPQALRIDMRQDLQHLEVLKTWPVRASAVVRGEMMWPGALLSVASWALLALALFLSGNIVPRFNLAERSAVALAVAIVTPGLVFAQFTIHNGVALIFPAWVPLGQQRARGIDAMGQRLILLGATWLTLIVMALPGAIVGGAIWFAFHRVAGVAVLVPAALGCTAILALEVLMASEALGPAYERLDLMAVERAE
jgi:ABC-2 type transport system permease protein